jgi:hypothetical protein
VTVPMAAWRRVIGVMWNSCAERVTEGTRALWCPLPEP